MPRKKNQPEEYIPVKTLKAMKVLPPFKAVAEWCGGKIVNQGIKFSHIELEFEGQTYWAQEGTVIFESTRPDGTAAGYYAPGFDIEEFEKLYRKATPDA